MKKTEDNAPSLSATHKTGFGLSQEDVRLLLTESSAESRVLVMKKVAAGHASGLFDDHEMEVAEQIFRLLLKDTEQRVRESLADTIKHDARIPKDVALQLAHDVETVSLPILRYCDVLSDAELIDVITKTKEISRHLAIAQRQNISPKLVNALVGTRNESVVFEMIRNPGAEIHENTYEQIIEHFSTHNDIMSSMAERNNLPITTVEKLINHVSSKLGEELENKYNISAQELAGQTDQTREMATLRLMDHQTPEHEVEKLVNQMHSYDRLTASIILSALCRGNSLFFEMSVAKLSGVPYSNARILMNDRGELGFKAIYEKAGLPETMYQAIKMVFAVVRELKESSEIQGSARYANRLAEKILYYAEGKDIDNLPYILALIRQNVQH